MVRFGAEAARVALRGTNAETAFETDVVLAPRDARRAHLNGARLASAERLRLELRTLVFTPDRLAVVKGAPATRRAYIDRSLGRLSPAKASLPVEYAAAVGQRNAGLRRLRAGSSTSGALRPWTERVVELGTELVAARAEAAGTLATPFAELAGYLGLEAATIAYDGEAPTIGARRATRAGSRARDHGGGTASARRAARGGRPRPALVRVAGRAEDGGPRARPRRSGCPEVALGRGTPRAARRRSLRARRRPPPSAGRDRREGGQTVITATARAALPIEPAQTLAVSPGRIR